MKGVVVIVDGMGDLPCEQLGGKTPLEAAEMPNANFLASRGELGYMYPVKPGFVPESDEAVVSLFGNELISSTRGQLEARGTDIKLVRGDLALRANFATIDSIESGNILDRRAGRNLSTNEAEILAKALNKGIKLESPFIFKATIGHRGVLVFKGGFSDNVSGNDMVYIPGQAKISDKISPIKPLDEEDNSQYTANIVNSFLEKAFEILNNHPVNERRREKGLLPANFLLVRGAGIEVPKLKNYKKWASASYMPLEKGFSRICGMKTYSFDYPKLRGIDVYANLWEGLKKACKFSISVIKRSKRNSDYVYVHIKETDLPGHDGKPIVKKEMLEYIDKTLFNFLRKFAPPNNINVVITADHSTPCKTRMHSADPVPVLFYNHEIPKEKKFNENEARKGKLGRILGKELLGKVKFGK
ncbi:MAG: alkaline phosphatase family protein [Candidatus Nanoarchaeia archaeon]|nr:alkaline phosphatase family protein [Candidatus Nanoarchaeia archaeon]MDD5358466.1 alkaline phosphatase family protein [Candidatus Nanoarchaeia archaeon]MDD5588980.1 alkaline phosphatase family protein [Candidatus Nanoarchaeia archaeon]